MNYTAHPSTINDGEVSFKEKQYLLPKYKKIARDNIGAVDTEKVLELIKEHGGGGEASELEYFTAHDSSSYWKNYTSSSLITKMLTVDKSKGDSINFYKEEGGYTAIYLNKGLYYLHCEIEYHNSPDMTGFFKAETWGGAGYPFEYRTSEMLDLSKSVLHIAPFDALIMIDRDHTYLSLSNNFISDDGSMYRFINRLQIYKLPSATIEGGSGDIEYYNAGKDNGTVIDMNNDSKWLPLANQSNVYGSNGITANDDYTRVTLDPNKKYLCCAEISWDVNSYNLADTIATLSLNYQIGQHTANPFMIIKIDMSKESTGRQYMTWLTEGADWTGIYAGLTRNSGKNVHVAIDHFFVIEQSAIIGGSGGDKQYVDSKVATEAQNRETADLNLQNQIDTIDSNLQATITAEQTARENADTQLQTAINNEQTARVNDISALQANKQDKLIAGSNISITGNVISSTGGGGGGSIGWQTSQINTASDWTLIGSEFVPGLSLYALHQNTGDNIMLGIRNIGGAHISVRATMYPVANWSDGVLDSNFSVYYSDELSGQGTTTCPLSLKGAAEHFKLLGNYATFKVMPKGRNAGAYQFMPFTLDIYSFKEGNTVTIYWRVL